VDWRVQCWEVQDSNECKVDIRDPRSGARVRITVTPEGTVYDLIISDGTLVGEVIGSRWEPHGELFDSLTEV
jgi:hypothetical protein